jgi:serum/glucocorticoid-regulated kinase 2
MESVNVNSFLTVSVIGKGSYAKVILVKKKDTAQYFAMKILKKSMVEQRKQETHVKTEKEILMEMNGRPFLIDFYYSFQTEKTLCFVLEYCPGGELFNLLQKRNRFSEDQTRFYAAQIVIALEYLHIKGIIYRDLKPENVLIDAKGYIKITDFGLSRMNVKLNEAKSICGTPEYLAPEIILKNGYGMAVDWWTLGSIIYEMLMGVPPFYTNNRQELFEKIKEQQPRYSSSLNPVTRDILEKLLEKDPKKRLGSIRDADEVKNHPWFQGINWEDLKDKKYEAPYVPKYNKDLGLGNFDTDFTEMTAQSPMDLFDNQVNKNFSDFSYNIEAHENILDNGFSKTFVFDFSQKRN